MLRHLTRMRVGLDMILITVHNRHCPDIEVKSKCYGDVLSLLKSDQEENCQRACKIKVYSHELDIVDTNSFASNSKFNVDFTFGLQYSRDLRSEKLFKTVKKEYLIMSFKSMLGNVGGTMGMFIGFSFIGTSEWFMDTVFSKILTMVKTAFDKYQQDKQGSLREL